MQWVAALVNKHVGDQVNIELIRKLISFRAFDEEASSIDEHHALVGPLYQLFFEWQKPEPVKIATNDDVSDKLNKTNESFLNVPPSL